VAVVYLRTRDDDPPAAGGAPPDVDELDEGAGAADGSVAR
jgi:hypothetical protein